MRHVSEESMWQKSKHLFWWYAKVFLKLLSVENVDAFMQICLDFLDHIDNDIVSTILTTAILMYICELYSNTRHG
jgi:hypothetical protein